MLLRVAAEYIPSPSPPQLMLGRHSGIGNRIPRFPGFWGDFPIPDSRSAGNRESGNGPFPDRPGTGTRNRGPDSASRGVPGLSPLVAASELWGRPINLSEWATGSCTHVAITQLDLAVTLL